jgi:hypothetical protein
VILDTKGNIFGGFTPLEWESVPDPGACKADESLKSFLFTLRNPHNIPARRFALKAEQTNWAIACSSIRGPDFGDFRIYENCNAYPDSFAYLFGTHYTNDTGLDGETFLTGAGRFKVKEIEVFEITD